MTSILPVVHASRRFEWSLLAAFVLLATAIGTAGFFQLRRQQAQARQTIHEELAAVADLKVGQIVNWRNERLADARFFTTASFVARDVQAFLADPSSPAARAETLGWLTQLQAGDRYEQVILFDSRGEPCLTLPATTNDPGPLVRAHVAAALQTNGIVMFDLHRGQATNDIHLDILFPVFPPSALNVQPAAAPLAVILLQLDPHRFLYPLVRSWPTPSRSGETVLLRVEGDEVVFLSELRHRTNTALKLRFALSEPDLPAAIALRGRERIVEGRDYRQVPVLAAFRPVPDSPWWLGAKVDQAEVYGPLRAQAVAVGSAVAVLLLAVALGLGLMLRQRDAAFLSRELALEREHKTMAERFAHLMRHANDIILLADPGGRILEANDRALESYGYSLAELQQKTLPDLRAPETRAAFPQQLESLDAQGSAVYETLHRRKDGTTFPVEVSGRIVDIGGVPYKLGIIRDITQRQQTAAALRESEAFTRTVLEKHVVERTAQLENANTELRAVNQQFAASNKELEAFTYSVSHDLRAPLRHITGFCELLHKHAGDRLDERGQHYLRTVSDAAQRMGLLIDDLLLFSRTGRAEMRQTEVRLDELVQEVICGLQPEIRERAVEWQTGALPTVKGDRALLRQVFVNLLSNALKYTRPRNPARIEIGCRQENAGEAAVFVRDNGVGFDPAYAHKLFGVFQRLHHADEFEGTGIGLANVQRIVLRHGGRTWAEGKPNEGATFYVTLPTEPKGSP